MLHKNVIENRGFRSLDEQELEAVSGGFTPQLTIPVSGARSSSGSTSSGAYGFAHGDGAGGLAGGNPFYSLNGFTGLNLEALEAFLDQNSSATDTQDNSQDFTDADGDGLDDVTGEPLTIVVAPDGVTRIDVDGDGLPDVIRITLPSAELPSTVGETTVADRACLAANAALGMSDAAADQQCSTNLTGQNPDEPGISQEEKDARNECPSSEHLAQV